MRVIGQASNTALLEALQNAFFPRAAFSGRPKTWRCTAMMGPVVLGHPDAVVSPESADEVAISVRAAVAVGCASGAARGRHRPRGRLRSHPGGLVINMTRMNKILEIDTANMTATVQPGVVTARLQAEVEA